MNASNVVVTAVLVAIFAVTPPSARAGMLIGGTTSGTIYDVDPLTGLATNPRDTGLDPLWGLAMTPSGDLFGLGVHPDFPSGSSLLSIEVETGGTNFVGTPASARGFGTLAFDPLTNDFFSIVASLGTTRQASLVRIDALTGIGKIGIGAPLGALEFDPNDARLFLITEDRLFTWDRINENVLDVLLSQTVTLMVGFAVFPDGRMFVTDNSQSGVDFLYRLDPDTGVLSGIGPTGVEAGLTSLTIPEPATVVLLGAGATLCGITMRRRYTSASRGARKK